jgi:hypothetical protein
MITVHPRCVIPILVCATTAAADPAPPVGELIVVAPPPKPGASSTVTFDADLDLDFNFGGMAQRTKTKQTKSKKVEVVSVAPDGTVEKRITYTKRDTRIVIDGQLQADPSPIRGKTYRVTWKDAVIDVRAADGKPAPAAEVDQVKKEEVLLQAPEMLGKALAGMRLVEGKRYDVPAAALDKLVTGEYRPQRVVLTYRGKVPEGARIDAEVSLANKPLGTHMFLDLKGELVIDDTGWCRSLKVTGQVRAELNGSVVGSGAATGVLRATPLR